MMTPTGAAPRPLALLSAYEKQGLLELARALAEAGYELLSTGGTRRVLAGGGLPVLSVEEYTGQPELFDGRVKTLHPKIHAGILCRRGRPDDLADAARHGVRPIDVVVVNLYPFQEAVRAGERDPATLRELIDIGGPTLLRAAAKSWPDVTVVPGPEHYAALARAAGSPGGIGRRLRRALAAEAFAQTAAYDRAIARHLAEEAATDEPGAERATESADAGAPDPGRAGASADDRWPATQTLELVRIEPLRYGENPHQPAALYRPAHALPAGMGGIRVLSGRALSYNNLLDLDAALALLADLVALSEGRAAAAVLKHAAPCGAALADDSAAAFEAAYQGDPESAFGGIVAVSPRVTAAAALAMVQPGRFLECIAAPAFDDEAARVLTTRPRWGKRVRLVVSGEAPPAADRVRALGGAFLLQAPDTGPLEAEPWEVQTPLAPSEDVARSLRLARAVVKHLRSNAIACVRGDRLVGAGNGQPSRVRAVDLALRQAGEQATGAVLASDGFFPFPDSIERAAAAGITAAVEPGGSRRDPEVIAAAKRLGVALVFTRTRHFLH